MTKPPAKFQQNQIEIATTSFLKQMWTDGQLDRPTDGNSDDIVVSAY